MVHQLPEQDQYSVNRSQLLAQLDICMGGRVAEELIFGKDNVTTGASSDLKQATRLARDMVLKYGLSEGVGQLHISQLEEVQLLSPELRQVVDNEIKALLDNSYQRASRILTQHNGQLHTLAQALLQFETLSGAEISQILQGQKLNKEL
eukprot:TRINITY_DN1804_c0_g1_i8.p1 TRINITY_DN1804_c0_g1~~TRINITY_DN1804_c0_g1_i8.p1  ORF type:complete len:149 (+),score=42.73 TRINITY_DN1804_c0_g1_i8:187-633(+)